MNLRVLNRSGFCGGQLVKSDGRGLTSALSMVVGFELGRRDVAQQLAINND